MKLYLSVTLTLLVLGLVVDGRGRGGGSRGGGSRSGSRISRGSSSRSGVSRYSGSGYRSALTAGVVVFGMTRYRSRYYGTRYYREDPPICYSKTRAHNSTYSSAGYFICPDGDDPEKSHCCGEEDDQTCCGFWEDGGRVAGAVIGIIIGVVFFVCAAAFGIFMIMKCMRNRKRSTAANHSRPMDQYNPDKVDMNDHQFKY